MIAERCGNVTFQRVEVRTLFCLTSVAAVEWSYTR